MIKTGTRDINKRAAPTLRERNQSIIGIPLKIEDLVIGALYLVDSRDREFTETESYILRILASQSAQVIKSAGAVEKINSLHYSMVNAVKQIVEAISPVRSLDDILTEILDWALSLLGATLGTIELIDPQTGWLSTKIIRGMPVDDEFKANISRPGGVVGLVIAKQKPIIVPDTSSEEEYIPLRGDIRSELAVPIHRNNRIIGVLNIEHTALGYFNEKDLILAESIAGLTVMAINDVSLYDELNARIAELKNIQDEIANKERILVLTSVAADFVHRMNNIAGTIPHWTELAKRQIKKQTSAGEEKALEYLDTISREAKTVLEKARALNKPLQEARPIDVRNLLRSIIAQMEVSTPANIQISFNQSNYPGKKTVAQEQQLSDVLFNVLDNARKSLGGKGEIAISLKFPPECEEGVIEITIADNGIGIADEIKDRVFELGANNWSDGEGMGYGLWRARNIINALGGNIRFESVYGKGSTFVINLPIFYPDEE